MNTDHPGPILAGLIVSAESDFAMLLICTGLGASASPVELLFKPTTHTLPNPGADQEMVPTVMPGFDNA